MSKTVVALVAVILTLALAAPAHAEALLVHQCTNPVQSADGAQTPCTGLPSVPPGSSASLCREYSCSDSSSLMTVSQGQHPGWLSPQTLLLICGQGLSGSPETAEAPVVMAGLSVLPYPSGGTCPEQNEPLAGLLALLFMGCLLMGIAGIIRRSAAVPAATPDAPGRMPAADAYQEPFSAGRNVTPLKPRVSAGS